MKNQGAATPAVVKSWTSEKGFGFLRVDGVLQDVFVHHRGINMSGRRDLVPGQAVVCQLVETEKGIQAVQVTPVGAAAPCPTCGQVVG